MYTGHGKGKTTASIGLGIRAAGAGLNVCMIQFVKGRRDSALNIIDEIDNFEVKQFGKKGIREKDDITSEEQKLAQKAMKETRKAIKKDKFDLLILEEINIAIDQDLVDLSKIIDLIEKKPNDLELVLTGRYAKRKLIKYADLVTKMKDIKHYLSNGVKARRGIEY